MQPRAIAERVTALLAPYLEDRDIELWNVELKKDGRDNDLIITIDRPEGIGTDDCESVSRYIDKKLDDEQLIPGSYRLIVSSPGMDRTLLTDEHFARYFGSPVDVSLYRPVNCLKKISGLLGARNAEILSITGDSGDVIDIPRECVSKVKLQVIF